MLNVMVMHVKDLVSISKLEVMLVHVHGITYCTDRHVIKKMKKKIYETDPSLLVK